MRTLHVSTIALGLLLVPCAHTAIIHSYDLTSSLNDLVGSVNLTGNSADIGPGGYSFAAGQAGLSLSNGLPGTDSSNYTIEMRFDFDTVGSLQLWSDILNFHNSDDELYDYCGVSSDHGATSPCALQLYPDGAATPADILSGNFVTLVFNRNGSTNLVNAWINGTQVINNASDSTGRAIFSDTNNIIRFFQDENSGGENSPGTVSLINIYDAVYSPSDLPAGPTSSTPEPGSLALLAAGGLGLIGRWRLRGQAQPE